MDHEKVVEWDESYDNCVFLTTISQSTHSTPVHCRAHTVTDPLTDLWEIIGNSFQFLEQWQISAVHFFVFWQSLAQLVQIEEGVGG